MFFIVIFYMGDRRTYRPDSPVFDSSVIGEMRLIAFRYQFFVKDPDGIMEPLWIYRIESETVISDQSVRMKSLSAT